MLWCSSIAMCMIFRTQLDCGILVHIGIEKIMRIWYLVFGIIRIEKMTVGEEVWAQFWVVDNITT